MRIKYHKIFLFAAVAALFLPFLALAANLDLETIYPTIPGAEQVITGRAKLPDIIRYVVNWAIIIAALATAFSLVYAGVQYLTSVGRANAMAAAKSRIGQCLLGLLIIASSYLVLQTINPQLTIMTIRRQQVGSGIVMFTKAGLYGTDKVGNTATTNKCYAPPTPAADGSCAVNTVNIIDCYNPNMVNGLNTANSDTLESLIKAGEARFLSYDMPNLTAEFGNMVNEEAITGSIVNFTKFPIYAIGFWGDDTTQGGALVVGAKIFAYPNTQYNTAVGATAAVEYRMEGKVGDDGTVSSPTVPGNNDRPSCKADTPGSEANELEMKIITIHDDFFNSEVSYYDEQTLYSFDPNNITDQPVRKTIVHPPLSIKMQGAGSGVVLYASESGASQRFAANAEDFSLSNVKFDNLADEIEVRNIEPKKGKIHNYLAILHSGYYYTGDVRYFFEKIHPLQADDDPYLRLPKIYKDESFWKNKGGLLEQYTVKVNLTDLEKKPQYFGNGRTGDTTVPKYCGAPCEVDKDDESKGCKCAGLALGEPSDSISVAGFFFYPSDPLPSFGNLLLSYSGTTVNSVKTPVNSVDQFGRLRTDDRASSLEIFELEMGQGIYSTNTNISDGTEPIVASKQKIVCREVKLCTGKGLLGDCLVFVPNIPDYIKNKFLASDRYNSTVLPMPFYAPVNIPNEIESWVKIYNDDGATVIEKKKIEFANKIKSISVEGDCAVILFENAVKSFENCDSCTLDFTSSKCKECWNSGGPGSNSEVFTQSVSDLTSHSISGCGGRERFGFGDKKNCASAIAIFPIKKTEE